MTDYRLVWLRDRISKIVGVHDHPDALENLIKDHRENFIAFLDAEVGDIKETEKCLFYVYRTFYDRLVEKEVVTIEKGKKNAKHSIYIRCLICPSVWILNVNVFFSISSCVLCLVDRDWKFEITILTSFSSRNTTVPRIMTPPPVEIEISKERKGKKGKGKKMNIFIFIYFQIFTNQPTTWSET